MTVFEVAVSEWIDVEEIMQGGGTYIVSPSAEITDLFVCTTLVVEEDWGDAIGEITSERGVEIRLNTEEGGGDVWNNLHFIPTAKYVLSRLFRFSDAKTVFLMRK